MTRARIIFAVLLLFFLIIVERLLVIQVLNQNQILETQNFLKLDKKVPLRGEIYDSLGKPLVLNRRVFEVYGNTDLLRKNSALQKLLKSELKIKNSTLSAILVKDNWRRLATNITEEQKSKLASYYPEYLNFEEGWQRYYPEGSSSAHLSGFVGKDEVGGSKGYLGVEGYFNQELSGRPYLSESETDLFGIPFIGSVFNEQHNFSGLDLHLTIDTSVQKIVEDKLYQGLYRYEAKKGCAIVLDPKGNKIRALACVPAYYPQKYFEYSDADFLNPALSTIYEPGSTFKPLVVAMALAEKKITPKTVLEEKGPLPVGEYIIRTWDNKYREKISVGQTLAKSSNVGMVKIIQKMPKATVAGYFNKLGLRSLTEIELEGETNSLIKDPADWYDVDYATLAFGQGFAITPLQLIKAFSVFTNNGMLQNPTVVEYLYDAQNKLKIPPSRPAPIKVFSEKTVSQMKTLLREAIDKSEAYWPNKLEGYAYCGKTGTAQIAVSGKYDPSKTNASFIGFLPCNNPKFLMLVLYQEPKSSPWGSETAAPVFFEIAKQLILYYNIAPET